MERTVPSRRRLFILFLLVVGWAPVAYLGVVLGQTLLVILSPIVAALFTAYLYVFVRSAARNAKRS